MPVFDPLSRHVASIVVRNMSDIAIETYIKAMAAGLGDGSSVDQTGPAIVQPGYQIPMNALLIMPGSPGTYYLKGEVWSRPYPANGADFVLVSAFDHLGETITVGRGGEEAAAAGGGFSTVLVLAGLAIVAAVGYGLSKSDKGTS